MPEIHPPLPPDHSQRVRALAPDQSILVQAPAGSGKTTLLTQRFLLLLGQAEKPEEIVAITFTRAAAAEMRNRILAELENAERNSLAAASADPLSLPALARRAWLRSQQAGWNLLDQHAQLRITTIDAFCRALAQQCPLEWGLLSSLGGNLELLEEPKDQYRQAARRTLELLKDSPSEIRTAIEQFLLWRDNSWKDAEDLIVEMLAARNRWWQAFVFSRHQDWDALRAWLESAFHRSLSAQLHRLNTLLDQVPNSRDRALVLARFACDNGGDRAPFPLAQRAALPIPPYPAPPHLADAADAYASLANFLLIKDQAWRKPTGLNVTNGFPATPEGKAGKAAFGSLIADLADQPGLLEALHAIRQPIPHAYSHDEWKLVRHCFTVLTTAAAQLQLVFAETGAVDFTEVAQIAHRILIDTDGSPSDFALQQADLIHHLLIDEFQDTSHTQHKLVSRLISAWPDRTARSVFCVGDPMQSIYGFREAEVELFERVGNLGFAVHEDAPLALAPITLSANFRTQADLVRDLNTHFQQIFPTSDPSGVQFAPAQPMLPGTSATTQLHLTFTRAGRQLPLTDPTSPAATRATQLDRIVHLIQSHWKHAQSLQTQALPGKFRIAVLAQTKKSLQAVAAALDSATIPYRALDLVALRERPEVLDAIALARALLNPIDRTAWLGILRAPWCGLTLSDLHLITSADDSSLRATAIPDLLQSRLPQLAASGQLSPQAASAAQRVASVMAAARAQRSAAASLALGTWIELVWKSLGGESTVAPEARQNLRLLWNCLDTLPNGELDLLANGPDYGLNAALNRLFAQPDPDASPDLGVQLMTIHKSKGLEFEIVILIDLDAATQKGERSMISWLERGIPTGDTDDETEFLIAPIQPKGQSASPAKQWVDGIKRQRNQQEMRRLLYVAATRARNELHLFARPRFTDKKGIPTLSTPNGNLLATAWPALQPEIQQQFAQWSAPQPAQPITLIALADAGSNLLLMPTPHRPTRITRLAPNVQAPGLPRLESSSPEASESLYARTQGGLESRLEGTAIHLLLDALSRLRLTLDPAAAAAQLANSMPLVTARLRAAGLDRPAAGKLASRALAIARSAALHPTGAWITAPHPEAASESRWTGLVSTPNGRLQPWNLRPDRVFLAPRPDPQSGSAPETQPIWWIIDYKTSHAVLPTPTEQAQFLASHRQRHLAQLETYSRVLRQLRGPGTPIRLGLFYPRQLLFDHWPI